MALAHMQKLRRVSGCPVCAAVVSARVSEPDLEQVYFVCGQAFGADTSSPISADDYCRNRADLAADLWNVECSKATA
ncbi:hypothetical protein FB480_103436 [Agrobacterium vitis]|nr:hypothetical protein FB480_103436 [Agrobacterium vitis]